MSQKISSGVALTLIFVVAGTIGLLLWLGNERGMSVDDPRFFDFEKPGGSNNWLDDNDANSNEKDDPSERVACPMDAKECQGGFFVGRNAEDNCEFYPCPEEEEKNKTEIDTSN